MISAYLRLLALRWRRRPGARLAVGLLAVVPVALVELGHLLDRLSWSSGRNPFQLEDLELVEGVVFTIGAFAVSNLVAAAINDERTGRRAVLLRVGDLDGARAVVSFLLFGCLWAVTLSLVGHVAAWTDALLMQRGAGLGDWLGSFLFVVLLVTLIVPLATTTAFLLPRPAALVAVNTLVLYPVFMMYTLATDSGAEWGWPKLVFLSLAGQAVCVGALSPWWRRLAHRVWA